MSLSPPSTLPKSGSKQRTFRVTAGVLIALVLAAAIVGGWLLLRRARAAREALAREPAGTVSPAAGEDIKAGLAIFNYLARFRAQLRDHEAAFQRLQHEKVLSWNIHDRAEIETDRQIIRQFLDTNTRLLDTLQYGPDLIRAELNTAKVPADVRDSALARYAKSQAPLLPLQLRIRHCDQLLGDNALAVLDLLDFNWGNWRRDETTGRMDFNNTVIIATFKDYAEKIKAANTDREDAQKELAALESRRPLP